MKSVDTTGVPDDGERRHQRGADRRSTSPPNDGPRTAAGVYLDLFAPPALANDADTYLAVYAAVKKALEGAPLTHAHAAYHAAYDAAKAHVNRFFAGGGEPC